VLGEERGKRRRGGNEREKKWAFPPKKVST